MAHDGRVVRQADVAGIVLVVVALRCRGLLLGDDEGALHIDAHRPGVLDGLFDNGRVGAMGRVPPGPRRRRRRRRGCIITLPAAGYYNVIAAAAPTGALLVCVARHGREPRSWLEAGSGSPLEATPHSLCPGREWRWVGWRDVMCEDGRRCYRRVCWRIHLSALICDVMAILQPERADVIRSPAQFEAQRMHTLQNTVYTAPTRSPASSGAGACLRMPCSRASPAAV